MLLEELTVPVDCWFLNDYMANDVEMCTACGDFNELSGTLAIVMVTQFDHAENELKS